jgi:DNA-binding IclR family transcriptional regulator
MFLSDGTILRLMHDLREKTSESVVLGTQSGLRVQYIQVMRTLVRRTAPQVASGRLRPLLRSAMGIVMLSTKDDQEVLALARRINAEEPDPSLRVKPEALLEQISNCRRDGYGYTEGATTPGSGMVAMLLASPPHQPPMALGIGTVIPKLKENKERYIAALRRVVDVHGKHMRSQYGVH